jgi:hypothetical protein
MYYPYFRGKQFDLLALKSLLEMDLLSTDIQPIIEPVKQSKTFWNTIALFQQKQHPFFVIINPQEGDFLTEEGYQQLQELSYAKACIVDQPIESIDLHLQPDLWIIHQSSPALASDWHSNQTPVLVSQEFRLLKKIQGPKILMHDFFTRLPRNSFYQELPEEIIPAVYQSYSNQGFSGYSDFSIDSKIYYVHSYPSKTIVLHWVFVDEQQALRIAHFVSDETLESQKEKFLHLMTQVVAHEEHYPTQTAGLSLLLDAYQKDKFPGMGVLRKAAVMNHLELISRHRLI